MKRIIYTILLCSVSSLAIGQVVSPQKVRFQEVDMDSSRTNHRGPGWGFWFGSGDTTFFYALKDSFEVFIRGKLVLKTDSSYLAIGRKAQKTFGLRFFGQDSLGSTILMPDFVGMTDVKVILPRPNPSGDTVAYRRNRFRQRISTTGQWMNDSTIFVAGSNVTLSQTGNTVTIAATGGGTGTIDTLYTRVIRDSLSILKFQFLGGGFAGGYIVDSLGDAPPSRKPAYFEISGSLIAPAYTVPGTLGADTIYINFGAQFFRTIKAHSPLGISDLEGIVQLKMSGTWKNAGYWYGSNTYAYPPWFLPYDTILNAGNPRTDGKFNMLYFGYSVYPNTWGAACPVTYYSTGTAPGGTLEWKIKTTFSGYSPPAGDDANVHSGLFWANWVLPPVADTWQTAMTIDAGGNVIIYGNLTVMDSIYAYKSIGAKFDISAGRNGTFGGGVTVGHADGVDTTVGTVTLYTATGRKVVLYASGISAGTFVLPVDTMRTIDTVLTLTEYDQKYRIIELTTNSKFHYLVADSGASFIVQHDTLHIRAIASSGSSGASYYTAPAERPPDSPSSFNDEFDGANGTTADTGGAAHKWRWLGAFGHPNMFAQHKSGALVMADTSSGSGDFLKLLGQPITDTAWTITIRMTTMGQGLAYTYAGIFVYDSTNGKGTRYTWVHDGTDQSGKYFDVLRFTAAKTMGAEINLRRQREIASAEYLRLEKTAGKALNVYLSQDGIAWNLSHTELSTAYIETAGNKINWIGLAIGCAGTNKNITAATWWFRYNWTADFDPTLHH